MHHPRESWECVPSLLNFWLWSVVYLMNQKSLSGHLSAEDASALVNRNTPINMALVINVNTPVNRALVNRNTPVNRALGNRRKRLNMCHFGVSSPPSIVK